MTFEQANEAGSFEAVEAFDIAFYHSLCKECTRVAICRMSDYQDDLLDSLEMRGTLVSECNYFDQKGESHDL